MPLTATTATLDHLVTRGAGGSNRIDNQVLACNPCNQDRKDMPATEWRPKVVIRYREPETAANAVPLTHGAQQKVGTLLSRADADWVSWELGSRVAGSMVHENANLLKNRLWRLAMRAIAAGHHP